MAGSLQGFPHTRGLGAAGEGEPEEPAGPDSLRGLHSGLPPHRCGRVPSLAPMGREWPEESISETLVR
ncbi:Nuak Family Snf1-Like Kinase 1 [Manis pentadactyla]|nr:Nuak Family Snf1-Like Kinase 1 [Manis pentadactyla]